MYCFYFTLLYIALLAPLLTLSCIQFGSPLNMLAVLTLLGKKTCPPLQLTILSTMVSATSVGSMMTAPCFLSSSSTGPRRGVRTQLGCIDVVSTFGLL
jgi:hypothetical protein